MGKKYIIELEEPEMFDERKYYQCSQMPWWAVSENIVENLTPYTEPDLDAIRNEAYEKGVQDTKQHWVDAPRTCAYKLGYENGINDAWEAARKIAVDADHGGLPAEALIEIFSVGIASIAHIFDNFSASEAIEKIRQYEQEKEKQIQVGDEVITASGKAVVTGVGPVHFEYVYADGSHGYDEVKNVKKTGRRFPEISAVLEKMREES